MLGSETWGGSCQHGVFKPLRILARTFRGTKKRFKNSRKGRCIRINSNSIDYKKIGNKEGTIYGNRLPRGAHNYKTWGTTINGFCD